ncbi:unnamed protein product [Polarella glacialis]|uniref:Phosphofructokinase domain-containing protein n=3 Tax=Polarella glacialis TaxID=89957 RepID=A0A813HXY8_POLGL|nr:unnamed protein product [Polarella glacialis]
MRRDDSFALGSGVDSSPGASSVDLVGLSRQASEVPRQASCQPASPANASPVKASPSDSGHSEEMEIGVNCAQRVGVVLIGRSGPGINNVITGLHDYLKASSQGSTVICFGLGLHGLIHGHSFELTEELLAAHRNQGGCDLLGQSQPEDLPSLGQDLSACAATVKQLQLDGLVVWGGRNVHSWTARLSEYFAEHKVSTRVVGVPASVQSDLPLIEQTLGYDTVCKLFASIVGNLATQVASSGKLWCFVRIPGRSISHIAAEVALETHPHVVLMSADTKEEAQLGLTEVTQMICNVIEARNRDDNNYGLVLIPDQLLASVAEMQQLFAEVGQIHKHCPDALEGLESGVGRNFSPMLSLLPPLSRALFQTFPERVRAQICHVIHEDSDNAEKGFIDLSSVETEVIFQTLVETELTRRVVLGSFKGAFQVITYSLPYHGRSAMPTNFDCDLGYAIGYAAGVFVEAERTGLLVDISKLKEDVSQWEVGGVPFSSLMQFKEPEPGDRSSKLTYSIRPRSRLLYDLSYESSMPDPCERTLVSPGPAQFEGPCSGTKTQTLCMPQAQRVRQMAKTEQLIKELKSKASAGCQVEVLKAVKMLLQGGVDLMKQRPDLDGRR